MIHTWNRAKHDPEFPIPESHRLALQFVRQGLLRSEADETEAEQAPSGSSFMGVYHSPAGTILVMHLDGATVDMLPSGGASLTVAAPSSCEGATVERLWFLGNRRDGTGEARVAIPLGKIAQGSVRIDLPAKAVRNCPIDLATAVPTIAEVKLRPWVERLTELARRISTTAAVVLPPAPTPSVGVAYAADTSPPDFTPFETVLEQSGLRARLWGTEEGHRFLEISTDRPLASGEFVYFALLRPSGEAEPALQGYAVSSEGPDAPVAAVFKVEEVPEGAELCVALVEKGSWNEDDLPLLEWSVHHAETESLGAALEPLLAEVRKAAGAAG